MEYSCAHCDCYDCDYLFCVLLARLIIAICVVVVLTSEALRIEGGAGAGVIKKHLKKDDAIKALRARASALIKMPDIDETELNMPDAFNAFLGSIKEEAQGITNMKMDGTENVIQLGLKTLSADALRTLMEIMDLTKGGRRGVSEERVLKIAPVLFPSIGLLDNGTSIIAATQAQLLQDFIAIYASEYHSYSDGSAKYNNDLFVRHVTKELDLREGAEVAREAVAGRGCVVS